MKKTVLVTGGAGFIGSHLCEYLLNKGNEVICVDNFFTGRKKNIQHLMSNSNFELKRHDTVHPLFLEVDQIYNLACPASPVHYQYNPVKTIKMGTVAMVNMLGLAKRCNARILQASTSEVYGNPLEHPQKETYWGNVNCLGLRSCYDESKRAAESLMMAYHRQNNVDIKIIRIFNTYGQNMTKNDGRVISNFIVQALKNEPITIYGDGLQTRSFCFVSDLVEGMYKMMNSESFIGPVNLGNPVEMSIKETALMIKGMTGSLSEIVYKKLPKDDPVRRKPDISLAKEKLNWFPLVPFEQGLKKTIDFFKQDIQYDNRQNNDSGSGI